MATDTDSTRPREVLPPTGRGGGLDELLSTVAATAAATCGFASVAVNLYRPAWDDYEIVAVHGRDDARAALLGATYPAEHWAGLLREEFRMGDAYLVPAGRFDWGDAPLFVPDLPASAERNAWHAEDALFAPMYSAEGDLLGVLSVDEPASGLRPSDEDIARLVGLAAHAAVAIQAAQSAEAARSHQAALAQLLSVSAKLNDGESVDDILKATCEGIREALGFQLVVIETPNESADRYCPRAAAGPVSDPAGLQIEVSIDSLRRVYDPAFEIEGCFLLPRLEAVMRVGLDVSPYPSRLNGRGRHAWDRHWLLVPLFDENGGEMGFIWADDPADRLLPSRARLQALRLFADNAQRALTSAEQRERLREAGERQRALVQHSPTGILQTGVDGRIRDWNDAARSLFGYDDERVLGQYPPWVTERDAFLERFRMQLARREVVTNEYTDVRSDGELVQVRTTSAPLLDANGEVTGTIASIIDVTAERRAQAEIEALYATTLDLIDQVDLDSVLSTIVTRASDLVGGDGGYLYLVDEEAGVARPTVATGVFAGRVERDIRRGQGIGGRVWETGESVVVADYATWEGRLPGFDDAKGYAVAGMPIRAGDRVVGVIGVGLVGEDRNFGDHEKGLLARFSDLASLALAKAQLYDRLEQQNAALEALHETALNLVNRLDPPSTLEAIVERARAVASSESAFLYLVEGDELVPRVAVGPFVKRDRRLARGEGLSGRVWETGEPMVVQDDATWESVGGNSVAAEHAIAAVPIRGEDGVVGVLGVGHRRTERWIGEPDVELLIRFSHLASLALQNAELYEALRKSEELYRKVVDNSTELIALSDLEGTIVFASDAHEQVLGYRPEDLVGQSLALVAESGSTEIFRQHAAEIFETGRPVERVGRVRHRSGELVTIAATMAPIYDDEGEPEMVLFVARDVTERERLEEQLRQSQKMEAIGRLAGGIAHDFNNLLTAIGGYADLASGQLPEQSKAQRSLGEIQRATERAAGLTRQLLAYSRKQVLQPKVVDVGDVVLGMNDILARLLGTHIALETRLSTGARTRVDPTQLEQVVMNLAINARDAMPKGGRLVIETSEAELDGEEYVLLTVTDTGQGMEPATLKLAFEPFFTTKALGEGTGLGLSTVYGIVKQTGGHVEADSEPGVGTAVRVYLPRVTDAPNERAEPAAAEKSAGSGTVLLVEDEELVRELVGELLQAAGYTVLAAADGASALELAAAHEGTIDVLVTDVVMPGMSGQQVAARLQAEHAGLRVLFTSGYAENAIATHGELTPGAAFLGKPFSARDLAAKLGELLDQRS